MARRPAARAPAARSGLSTTSIVVGLVVLLLLVLGGLGLGLGLAWSRRPGSSAPGQSGGVGVVTLEVIGERVMDAATGLQIERPCDLEAARVVVIGDRGTQRAVEDLIACLRARGVVVETA